MPFSVLSKAGIFVAVTTTPFTTSTPPMIGFFWVLLKVHPEPSPPGKRKTPGANLAKAKLQDKQKTTIQKNNTFFILNTSKKLDVE